MALNLLRKTELWITGITLEQVNLTGLAETVAGVLHVSPKDVLVVDVRPQAVTLDILAREVPEENVLGKERELLEAVGRLPGVTLTDAGVHSNGVLGLICAGEEDAPGVLDRVKAMAEEVRRKVARRAIVFPTGFELLEGRIQDTNTPYLKAELEKRGYSVTVGQVIDDDPALLHDRLSDALSRGFGLILTTGGVGAEDKDHTVEAIHRLDPQAARPYIVKFAKGTGRHVKDGVRIGVGSEGPSLMVALPGPHDEVVLASDVLFQGLEEGWDKQTLAQRLAAVLAEKWKAGPHARGHGACGHHGGHGHHHGPDHAITTHHKAEHP